MTDTKTLSTESSPPAEIAKAILKVMKEVTGVGKTGHNKFHNYDYSSKEDVLKVLQPAMVNAGLACLPSVLKWQTDEYGNFVVDYDMILMHESGVTFPVQWVGVAQDKDRQGKNGDKWFNKAATAAEKYFLLKLFHIPVSEDDADADANNASAGDTKSPAPKTAPKGATAAQKATKPPNGVGPDKVAEWWKKGNYEIARKGRDGSEMSWSDWANKATGAMEQAPSADKLKAFWQMNEANITALEDSDPAIYRFLLEARNTQLNHLEGVAA